MRKLFLTIIFMLFFNVIALANLTYVDLDLDIAGYSDFQQEFPISFDFENNMTFGKCSKGDFIAIESNGCILDVILRECLDVSFASSSGPVLRFGSGINNQVNAEGYIASLPEAVYVKCDEVSRYYRVLGYQSRSQVSGGPGALSLLVTGILSYFAFSNLRRIIITLVAGFRFGLGGLKHAPVLLRAWHAGVVTVVYAIITTKFVFVFVDMVRGRHSVAVGFAGLLKKIGSSTNFVVEYRAIFENFDLRNHKTMLTHRLYAFSASF